MSQIHIMNGERLNVKTERRTTEHQNGETTHVEWYPVSNTVHPNVKKQNLETAQHGMDLKIDQLNIDSEPEWAHVKFFQQLVKFL